MSLQNRAYYVKTSVENRTITEVGIDSSEGIDNYSIFVVLEKIDDMQNKQGTQIAITIPMSLLNRLFGYAISPPYTDDFRVPMYVMTYDLITASFSLDKEHKGSGFAEIETIGSMDASCESVTWMIALPPDTNRLDLSLEGVGFIPEAVPAPAPDRKFPLRSVVSAESGEPFDLTIFTNANTCDFTFVQDEKRLRVDISTIRGEKEGYFLVNMPDRLLGGNYTVLADNQPIDFKVLGSSNEYVRYTNNTQLFTTLEIKYDRDVKSIDILGTTAIPEFPLSLTIIMISLIGAIAASLISTRYFLTH